MKIYLSILIMICCTNNLFAVWKSIEGLYNANINCLASKDGKIFAGTMDGILLSTDSGNSYFKPDNELVDKQVMSIQVLSNNYIIAGTAYDGIYISTDNGESWQPRNAGLEGESLTVFNIYIDNERIYLATRDGIFLSEDNAKSWQDITGNMPMRMATKIAGKENILLSGASAGLHISRDGGKNWSLITFLAQFNVIDDIYINNNKIYAALRIGGFGSLSGLFVSSDNGLTWEEIAVGTYGYLDDIFVTDEYIMIATDKGLLISEHDEIKWENITKDSIDGNFLYNIDNYNLTSILRYGEKIIVGSVSGIFSSDDFGKTWDLNTPVLSGREVYSIEFINNLLYVGTESGLFLSEDLGTTWKNLTRTIGNQTVHAILFSGENIYVGTNYGIYSSSNSGESWNKKNLGMGADFAIYALLQIDNTIVAGSSKYGIFISDDLGETWIQRNSGISDPRIYCLNNIGNKIFAGIINTHPGLVNSNDVGKSWNECSIYQDWSYSPWVYSIAIRDNSIFIGTGWNGIYKSDDLGTTWQAKNNGPNDMKSHDVFSVALKDNFLIATSKAKNEIHNKLLLSTDSGENWVYSNMIGIENFNIRELYIKDDYVFAGATGSQIYSNIMGGFYYAKISDLINSTSVYDYTPDINDINIHPNTASDFITIQTSEVPDVRIFNTLGECVKTALRQAQGGTDHIKIDVSQLPTGVYFIKIGDRVEKFVKW